ncbi:MAG: hypothetical protein ACRC62_38280 [Microcoleus sp.]
MKLDDNLLVLYGYLGDCSVNSKIEIAGKKAYVQIWKKNKKAWNADKKQFEIVTPDKEESYLYDLVKDRMVGCSNSGKFISIKPCIPDMFWDEFEKKTDEIDLEYCEKIAKKIVIVSESEGEKLTDADTTTLEEQFKKLSGGSSSSNYAPKETSLDVLEGRRKFLLANIGAYGEGCNSIFELAAVIESLPESDKAITLRTIDLISILMQ